MAKTMLVMAASLVIYVAYTIANPSPERLAIDKIVAERAAKENEEMRKRDPALVLSKIGVDVFSWFTEGFDSVLRVNMYVENSNAFPVKDVGIKCTTYGKSGTAIGKCTYTAYEIFRPGEKRYLDKAGFGFIDKQSAQISCAATKYTIVE